MKYDYAIELLEKEKKLQEERLQGLKFDYRTHLVHFGVNKIVSQLKSAIEVLNKEGGKGMKDKRRKIRWFQKIYAILFGYFWLPCPICGKYFGGHEWQDNNYTALQISQYEGNAVCINCTEKAIKRNKLKDTNDKKGGFIK